MMLSPVRIGVLGAGYFGRLHALTVNSLSEAQLCAVVDSSATALAKLPTSLAQIPHFSDLLIKYEPIFTTETRLGMYFILYP